MWHVERHGRVAVLTGGLPGYFIAHADLADVAALAHGGDTGPHGPDVWERAISRLSAIPQPVIAAVNGQAWGGGFEVALGCLMRVASPAATFRFVEVADGAIPGAGGTQRLPRLIGLPRAAQIEVVTVSDAEWAARRLAPGEGLSLADRLCLALGDRLDADIWTADKAWGTSGRIHHVS